MSTGLTPESSAESSPHPTSEASPEARLAYRRRLRQQAVERRLSLPVTECAALSATICGLLARHFPQLANQRVGFCWPVNNEPDLRPLIVSWLARGETGFSALLPVVQGLEQPLAFREWTPQSLMQTDRFGIPTPTEGRLLPPQALLIPVNAFDGDGYRIGYGGGFFDRTLAAQHPPPLAIGVGFELARVASVRPEAHDVRLSAMVSEAGVFRHA
jgi:5-formyltetrahydrofolate cyclo-ligase